MKLIRWDDSPRLFFFYLVNGLGIGEDRGIRPVVDYDYFSGDSVRIEGEDERVH